MNLIANTTTQTGLMVKAALDNNSYPTGQKVADADMAKLKLTPAEFHGEWNYSIRPHNKLDQVIFSRTLRPIGPRLGPAQKQPCQMCGTPFEDSGRATQIRCHTNSQFV